MPPKKATGPKAAAAPSRASSRAQPAKEVAKPPAKAPAKANTASKRKADSEIDEPVAKKTKAASAKTPAVKEVKAATKAAKPAAATKGKTAKEVVPEAALEKAAPKKAALKKAAPKAALKAAPKKTAVKKTPVRETASKSASPAETTEGETEEQAEVAPAPKAPKAPKAVKAVVPKKFGPTINTAPTQKLDVYVFGEGGAGELGLGSVRYKGKMPIDVSRPRLNENLSAEKVGVVQVSVGGMHCAALTHDNKILTWGVNDQSALGRDTTWNGGLKDIDAKDDSDSEDEDDTGMNPKETTPTEIDTSSVPEGTIFTQVVACDSATFALTGEGLVYGWGTFRANDGILGFRPDIDQQHVPLLIPELKKITYLACGTDHVLAVDQKGKAFAWGAGEQNQLARRVVARTSKGALIPREFGLQRKKIVYVACGSFHSFAMDAKGDVYSWGLNTFGQTGIPKPDQDTNVVTTPTLVKSLKDYDIKEISGGAHHTISCTKDGQVLIWGRIDTCQGGMAASAFPKEKVFFDETKKPRFLITPHVLPDLKAHSVTTANDTCIVITTDGKAYSWGFSANYQTGQGTTDDIVDATEVANTAVKGKRLVFGGVGGQFSVLAGIPEDKPLANGV